MQYEELSSTLPYYTNFEHMISFGGKKRYNLDTHFDIF